MPLTRLPVRVQQFDALLDPRRRKPAILLRSTTCTPPAMRRAVRGSSVALTNSSCMKSITTKPLRLHTRASSRICRQVLVVRGKIAEAREEIGDHVEARRREWDVAQVGPDKADRAGSLRATRGGEKLGAEIKSDCGDSPRRKLPGMAACSARGVEYQMWYRVRAAKNQIDSLACLSRVAVRRIPEDTQSRTLRGTSRSWCVDIPEEVLLPVLCTR